MAKAPSNKESIQQLITCSVCLDTLDKPVIFPCVHHICKKCKAQLKTVENHGIYGVLCPTCRQFASDESIKDNFVMEQLISLQLHNASGEEMHNCEICLKEESSHKCIECKIKICHECQKGHRRIPSCKGHMVKAIQDIDPEDKQMINTLIFCPDHPDKVIEFSCNDCNQAICYKCKILNHENHGTNSIEKAIEILLPEAQQKLESVNENIGLLTKKADYLKHIQRQSENDKETLLNDIETKRLTLNAKVDNDAEELKEIVMAKFGAKNKEIEITTGETLNDISCKQSIKLWTETVLSHVQDANLLLQLQGDLMQCLDQHQSKKQVGKQYKQVSQVLPRVQYREHKDNMIGTLIPMCEGTKMDKNNDGSGMDVNVPLFSSGISCLKFDEDFENSNCLDKSERHSASVWGDQNSAKVRNVQNSTNLWGEQNSANEWGEQNSANEWGEQNSANEWGEQNSANEWGEQNSVDEWGEQNSANEWVEQNSDYEWGEQNLANEWGEQNSVNEWTEQNSANVRSKQNSTSEWGEENSANEWVEQNSANIRGKHNSANEWVEQNSANVRGKQISANEWIEQNSANVRSKQISANEWGEQNSANVRGKQNSATERGKQNSANVRGEQNSAKCFLRQSAPMYGGPGIQNISITLENPPQTGRLSRQYKTHFGREFSSAQQMDHTNELFGLASRTPFEGLFCRQQQDPGLSQKNTNGLGTDLSGWKIVTSKKKHKLKE